MPARFLSRSLVVLCALLMEVSVARAGDWRQWRGDGQSGSALSTVLAGAEAVDFELAWRRPLGSGYSSVSIVADLGVTMASMEGQDWVVAFDPGSGSERWRFSIGESFLGRSGSEDGPMSTPAIGNGHVFVLAPGGRFLALESSSGKLEWDSDLTEDFGSEPDYYGYSTAPIVAGDAVYLLAGGSEERMLIAFEPSTGRTLWKTGSGGVGHQNLAVATLGGIEQVVAPAESSVSGFATADGRLLWSHEFEGETEAGAALAVDQDRVLVTRWETSHLFEISSDGDNQKARELWQTGMLGNSYAVPIRHGEHLYGFNRRFLACVELETGELVWRSRPPGGQALIGIDDHLLLVADDGALVAVEATPQGYRESGRLDLFERRRVLTPPSFAGGRVFVRDLSEMAAVEVGALTGSVERRAAGVDSAARGELLALFGRIESGSSEERSAALAELESRYATSPVIESGQAHFLYRGDEPDLVIVGDMSGAHANLPMNRIADTEWFHRSFPAPTVGRWEYRYSVFEESRVDPMNDSRVETPAGERSVVMFGPEAEIAPTCDQDCAKGTVTSHEVQSTVPERSYKLSVYTPAGYEATVGSLPTVFWAQGEEAQSFGDVVAWLDGLIATGEIEPVLGVFLELPGSAWWEQSRARFEEVMDQDLMPFLEANYRVAPARERLLVLHGWSAMNGLLWALDRGMGRIAIQSPFFGQYYLERDLAPRLAELEPGRAYIDWGSFDQVNPDWGLDVSAQSEQAADMLKGSGFEVVARQTPGGANWTRWSAETGPILEFFFAAE